MVACVVCEVHVAHAPASLYDSASGKRKGSRLLPHDPSTITRLTVDSYPRCGPQSLRHASALHAPATKLKQDLLTKTVQVVLQQQMYGLTCTLHRRRFVSSRFTRTREKNEPATLHGSKYLSLSSGTDTECTLVQQASCELWLSGWPSRSRRPGSHRASYRRPYVGALDVSALKTWQSGGRSFARAARYASIDLPGRAWPYRAFNSRRWPGRRGPSRPAPTRDGNGQTEILALAQQSHRPPPHRCAVRGVSASGVRPGEPEDRDRSDQDASYC
jgi:hypothetical protein